MNKRYVMIAILLLTGGARAATPVTAERSWIETFPVSAAARLEVSNIWGSVNVRAGRPGLIKVSITEQRSAPDQALYELSLQQFRLDVEASASGVSLLVGHPRDRWQRMTDCRGCRVDYQFTIEVPPDAVLDVATVMDGSVEILGVAGMISASNVNGPIRIDRISNCESVNSVNGPVSVAFALAPLRDCRIETVNGDITLGVPADAGLDMSLDLFNGEVLTELPVGAFMPPPTVEQFAEDGRKRYRIRQQSGLRIGAGGPVYSIASINGDLRVRKIQ